LLVDVHEKLCHDVNAQVRIDKGVFMDATWMISTVVLTDTAMTNLDHQSDVRAGVPDSEIITVALVAAKYVANNHRIALNFMHQLHFIGVNQSFPIESSIAYMPRLDGVYA
jgi:hypothetical protein